MKEGLNNDNITVVSGYWNVKNKHDNKYNEWFKTTLDINQKYIFFCDETNKKYISKFRNKETHFIDYPLNNFYSKKYVKDDWYHEIHIPSKELGMIWNEKIHLLKVAKDNDSNPTDFYIWIDAGLSIYREKSPPKERLNLKNIDSLPKNKLCCSIVDNTVTGTSFMIHKDIIDYFHDKYYETLNSCNTGFECGIDQKILTKMLEKYPELFHKMNDGYGQVINDLYNLYI